MEHPGIRSEATKLKTLSLVFLVRNKRIIGGGSYILFKLAEGLARRGHKVTVFATNPPRLYPPGYKFPKGFQIRFFNSWLRLIPFINTFVFDKLILAELSNTKPTAVVYAPLVDGSSGSTMARKINAISLAIGYETPSWLHQTIAAVKQLSTSRMLVQALRSVLIWNPMREGLLASDLLIAISKHAKREIERWIGPESVDNIVHPGVDIESIRLLVPNAKSIKKKYQIVFIGRLSPNKNISFLLHSLKLMQVKGITTPTLVVVGHGPRRVLLEKTASALNLDVRFTGVVSDREKWEILYESLIMVVPTLFEGSVDVPAEAFATNTGCMFSDIPVAREDWGEKLEYFDPTNSEDFVEKITVLLSDSSKLKEHIAKGKSFTLEHYTLAAAAEQVEHILMQEASGR